MLAKAVRYSKACIIGFDATRNCPWVVMLTSEMAWAPNGRRKPAFTGRSIGPSLKRQTSTAVLLPKGVLRRTLIGRRIKSGDGLRQIIRPEDCLDAPRGARGGV